MDADDTLSPQQLVELATELALVAFERSLPADVKLMESHRAAFRAGWSYGANTDLEPEMLRGPAGDQP
jgi:hypothetical protein